MRSVLVTGGTGSFGQHYVRHLLASTDCGRICVYSRDELKQAMMAEELRAERARLRFFIGDVRDRERLDEALYGVEVVVHAAALKRVDAIAYNPGEVRKTNINGTANVCAAAIQAGVSTLITISSDKAVQPTNAYGTSKQMAEWITVGANTQGFPRGTTLACVRYVNVLGSRGSVVHIWRHAVAQGRPVQITDTRMTRFWLHLDQAVQLVDNAILCAGPGDVFVPRLKAASMMDLAWVIAGEGFQYEVTGLRPGGEKVHETMLSPQECERVVVSTALVVPPEAPSWCEEVRGSGIPGPYDSEHAPRLSHSEIAELLERVP